ncbi:ABC transporter family protein [Synechococcus sp. BIOS-E4-1]|uniref:peptidase domain-containing ABC transporter n=1 Tax=Synechococcus sp. BIOS-E4-1 TaxID=1400864 RepID=UPI0016486E38|nr:ATP-binding cassette domain-containing protein [Synechococcus sp. BIOS-E4-1]QNI53644.1 ABC transporter family protein [Synechococcus sp. BIOS-E4-1]
MKNSKPSKTSLQHTSGAIRSLLTLDIATSIGATITDGQSANYESENLINKLRDISGLDSKTPVQLRGSLEDLLTSNGFYFRLSSMNQDRSKYEQIPIVCIREHDSTALIIYSRGSKVYAYSAQDNTSIAINLSANSFSNSVYEIYPVFPESLDTFWKLIKFSFPAIRPDLTRALLLSILVTAFALLGPIITARVVGDVVPSGNLKWIISTFIISILIALYSTALRWIQSFYLLRFNQKLNLRIQIPLYHRILSYPVYFLDQYKTGDLSSRAMSVNNILRSLSSSALSSVIGLISLIGFIGMMLYYDLYLSIPALLFILIAAIVQTILFRRRLMYERKLVERKADFFDESLQSINNIAQIRTNGKEKTILNRWSQYIFSVSSLSFKVSIFSDYNRIISKFLDNFGLSLIYGVLIYRLLNAKNIDEVVLSTSTFIVFQNAFSNFAAKFIELVELFNNILGRSLVDFERSIPLIRQGPEPGLNSQLERIELKGLIEFKNVYFAYPDSDRYVLSDASFKLYPGKFNVIFGASGCGKSTVVSIILGFYPIQSGSIFIDGREINELDIKNLRSQIGTVLQSTALSVSSIRDALTSGLLTPDEQIWETLKMVNLEEEIQSLPMKLETILSEGATNISGGQRQRLSIARALLRRPSMLIEDESTSALDNYSQKVIIGNLKEIGITRIVIAHRLTAIRDCDHMIILNGGSVEYSGSFEECLENSSYFSKIMHDNEGG